MGRSVGEMAAKQRSFWSSLPGLLTGLAGVLTGVVGLLGLAFSQGWIGDRTAEESGSGGGEDVVRISVEPETLGLNQVQPGNSVAVTNEGTGPITVSTEIEGQDAGRFSADDSDCGGELLPGRSCSMMVSLDAELGDVSYRATLVVSANDGEQSEEVALEGRSTGLLG